MRATLRYVELSARIRDLLTIVCDPGGADGAEIRSLRRRRAALFATLSVAEQAEADLMLRREMRLTRPEMTS
jgi:hypothetical protein